MAKVFSSLTCRGKIRSAMRHASERDKGGVLMSDDLDEKTGDTVREKLHSSSS